MKQAIGIALPSLLISGSLCLVQGQLTADRSLRGLKVAEGLEVTLFAAEPDLVNPTAMDIDASGRVWVTEAANYRIFKNPLTRPEGDRIRVLEDTNGDGRCDKATTFHQSPSVQAPLGIAVLGRRVYICQAPDLFYLEDTDGDGVADKRTVILTGFKGIDHDHANHGVIFGPDGHLYLSNGDRGLDVTDKMGNRVHVGPNAPHPAASVLRTDLEGSRLELLAVNLRNPYEPAVDSFGNVFISDNDDDGNDQCRIVFIMEGGNYGYWPRRRGNRRLDEVHWNEDMPGVVPKILKTGFGSPSGMAFYEGNLLPERYRKTLLHADAGPGVVRSYRLWPKGAAFEAEAQTLLSCPSDKWFRPVDVAAAPDGSIFVADWYDPGVGGHDIKDFARGRIYRIAPPGTPYRVSKPDISNPAAAAAALSSSNQAVRYLAYTALDGDRSADAWKALEALLHKADPVLRARALWLLGTRKTPAGMRSPVLEAARDPRPEFRVLAVRSLASQGAQNLRHAEWLLEDPDLSVLRALILRLQHFRSNVGDWPSEWILKLARGFDGNDRFYREALGIAMRGREQEFFQDLAKENGWQWSRPLGELAFQLHTPEAVEMAKSILTDSARPLEERMLAAKTIAAPGGDGAASTLIGQLSTERPGPLQAAILNILARDDGSAWPEAHKDARLHSFLRGALFNPALRSEAEQLIRDLRIVDFLPDLITVAQDQTAGRVARLSAIESIRRLQSPAALDPLRALLADRIPAIALAAAQAIHGLGNDDAYQALQQILLNSTKARNLRKETVRLLGRTRPGALLLLQLAEQGRLPQDLILEATAVTNSSPHESVRLMAQRLLPPSRARSGKPLPPIPSLLRLRGDANRGRGLFFSGDGPHCSRCHKISGQGRDVGPDLSRIGTKLAREALFESILNPSSAISHEYQVWLLRTRTRGYLDGYIRAETSDMVELVDANGNTARIPASEIVSRVKGTTSLMPAGLSVGMTIQGLVDLVDFLATLR